MLYPYHHGFISMMKNIGITHFVEIKEKPMLQIFFCHDTKYSLVTQRSHCLRKSLINVGFRKTNKLTQTNNIHCHCKSTNLN